MRSVLLAFFIFVGLCSLYSCSDDLPRNTITADEQLLAHYQLDGDAFDESVHHNHGRILGEVQVIPNSEGLPNSALQFDGEAYIEIIPVPSFHFFNKISISCKIRLDVQREIWVAIINQWNFRIDSIPIIKDTGYYLGIPPNTTTIRWNVSGEHVTSNTALELGKWYDLVCTYDGSQAKIYIDGTIDNSANIQGELRNNSSPLMVGVQSNVLSLDRDDLFIGALDDIRIYNYALSE
jgi:hypothetical protein